MSGFEVYVKHFAGSAFSSMLQKDNDTVPLIAVQTCINKSCADLIKKVMHTCKERKMKFGYSKTELAKFCFCFFGTWYISQFWGCLSYSGMHT